MTRFVSCPAHVRSADLGSAAVLVDLRTNRVETLLSWTRDAWVALAHTGDRSSVPDALGVPAGQVEELVRQLCADGFLISDCAPRPWSVPKAAPTTPSWGTSEIAAGITPPERTQFATAVLAGIALASVLVARNLGIKDVIHCVRNVAAVLPLRIVCLEETAAAMLVLALTGRRAGWCHGVAADPIRLHAWIALDGQPVTEPASNDRYTPLLQIP